MTYDLTKFDLGDMLKCSLRLREAASGAASLEASAHRTCRFLYDELQGPDGRRACALVRCYKTHRFGALEPDLQNFARGILGDETPRPGMKCLTLMATVGQSAAWSSRFLSRSHRAIPLPSPEIVEKAPMISQLIKELGVELSTVLQPSSEIVKEMSGKHHGVFHVENALGSPYIPAQQEFVVRYGITSVLGFGGLLFNGELFAVILFSTVRAVVRSRQIQNARPRCEERILAVRRSKRLQPDASLHRWCDANVIEKEWSCVRFLPDSPAKPKMPPQMERLFFLTPESGEGEGQCG